MKKREYIKRCLLLIAGLFLMATGITLMVCANLGTSPISSMPYVCSLRFTKISLGMFTFFWNIVLIFGQILILRRQFKLYQLAQIPLSLVFGVFVDFNKWLLGGVGSGNYIVCGGILAAGCVILAVGVSFTVLADMVMNSGEAVVQAIVIRTGKEFGTVKVGFDIFLVLLSVLCSLAFFGKVECVREGTVFAAAVTGWIVKGISPRIERFLQVFQEKTCFL